MTAAIDRLAQALADVMGEALASAATPSAAPQGDLTVEQVAARYGRTAVTVRSWLGSGKFPGAYKLHGRDWRVPSDALRAFDEAQRQADPKVVRLRDWRQAPTRKRRKIAGRRR